MSGIKGKVRENSEFSKKVGLFVGRVILINPSREEFKEQLGIDLDEESKATDYLGESKDGNTCLRVNVWLQDTKTGSTFRNPVSFYLENKERVNKDGNKNQYINITGATTWADDEENLKEWFKKSDYRKAFVGEEELYNFLRTWLGKLDFKDSSTEIILDWKKLMKGNVSELKEQLDGEFSTTVGACAVVKTSDKDGKQYQGIYNKAFFPEYSMKFFRNVDYNKEDAQQAISKKLPKEMKPHEKFVFNISNSEHGCKDSYTLKELIDYNSEDFLVGSDRTIAEEDPTY